MLFILFAGIAMTGCAGGTASFTENDNTKKLESKDALALHSAAWRGDINSVRALLDAGADVNAVAPTQLFSTLYTARGTPLHFAIFKDHPDIVRLLIEKGADLKARNHHGYTPLAAAEKLRRTLIVVILMEAEKEAYNRKHAKADEKTTEPTTPKRPAIKSDVDELPVIKAKPNKNSYAIVIGIENYRQKLPKVDFATHDAQTMTEYLTKIMGYPEENVVTLLNDHAAKSDFEKYFEKWLSNNVEKDGTVFIYYSGHGAPNTKTGDAFLVPYDGDPTFIAETGYSLQRLYDNLGKLQAKEIIVALDSCFSGAGGRGVLAKGARPLVMTMESLAIPSKVAVLSASSGDQISSTYEEKGHGLFTYFMLKGMQGEGDANGDGAVEIGELFNYIKPQVERIARKVYNSEQSPQLIAPFEKQKLFLMEKGR